jgi:hypothetical protein
MSKVFSTIIFCVFSYAMISLFFKFAEYVGRNGL